MFGSSRYSYLALKLGLAVVFLWFGIDKIIHPSFWLNAWAIFPVDGAIRDAAFFNSQFIFLYGVFEVLVGISLITGVFSRFFSVLATLFLISETIFVGSSGIVVRNVGLIGGLIAVFLWPNDRSRF